MCKKINEFTVAYTDFAKKTKEQNEIIMELERQNWDLTEENRNLENSVASKDMLISLYKTQSKSLEKQLENERKKYKNWKNKYKARVDIGIVMVCVAFLAMELAQFVRMIH